MPRSGWKKPSQGVTPAAADLQTVRQQESQDDSGESDSFNESGGNQHVGADAAGRFGLAGDAFACLSTDLADTASSADNGQAHSYDSAADADAFVGDGRSRLRHYVHQIDHPKTPSGFTRR
jgi:hypothetical protein